MNRLADEQIRELLERVTPGPWEAEEGYVGTCYRTFLVRPGCDGVTLGHHRDPEIRARYDADAEFAAAARSLVPYALSERERTKQACDRLRERRDRWRKRAEVAEQNALQRLKDMCRDCYERNQRRDQTYDSLRDLLRERRDRWRARAEEAQARLQKGLQQAGKIMTDMHNQRLAERREHETELDGLRERVQAAEQARNQALQSLAIAEERNQELERQSSCWYRSERDAMLAIIGDVQHIASSYAESGMMINPDWLLAHLNVLSKTTRGVQQFSTEQIVVLNGERGEVVALEALDDALLVTASLQRNWKGGEPHV